MTDDVDVGKALQDLRQAVAARVVAPPPAVIRARASRRPGRVIAGRVVTGRALTALVVAASVVAVALGVTSIVREQAAPPAPGGTRTPAVSPSASVSPAPVSSGPPAPTVRPSRSVAPWPAAPPDDPIARVAWASATVTLPVHPEAEANCPSGPHKIDQQGGPYPAVTHGGIDPIEPAYGDLTGDGNPEAVLSLGCLGSSQDSGHGFGQLLVVRRSANGVLSGLGWVGPRGALYPEYWVKDGTLFVEAHPWTQIWGYTLGSVLAYRWQGGAFVEVPSGYPPVQLPIGPQPEIDLRPVAGWLGCLGGPLQFLDIGLGTMAVHDGRLYDFTPPMLPDGLPHWLDLAGDGERLLVLSVACRRSGTTGEAPPYGHGVVVLRPAPGRFLAVDLVPVDLGVRLNGWSFAKGELRVEQQVGDEPPTTTRWRWNGTNFQPA